jgi:hypothetical protein
MNFVCGLKSENCTIREGGKGNCRWVKKRAFSSRHENRDEKAARKNTINPKFIFSSFALKARPVCLIFCGCLVSNEVKKVRPIHFKVRPNPPGFAGFLSWLPSANISKTVPFQRI